MADHLTLEVTRDGWTDMLQLSINQVDEEGSGDGYRIHGPKFNGSSKAILTHTLTDRDAAEIRSYLGAVFPGELTDPDRFQVEEARSLLARWDRDRFIPGSGSTERTLADAVRSLLGVVDKIAPKESTDD